MGYKPFKLTILQLIAPLVAMTLQEYKDAYGIDLTATKVDTFKLVSYNGEKYAIDQIKAVEGGHEIYFAGRVLSITDTVKTSDEIYDVANAKPIYYHPIAVNSSISESTTTVFAFSMSILNNDDTPFANLADFIEWAENLVDEMGSDVVINCSGYFKNTEGEVTSVSYLLCALDKSWRVRGANASATKITQITISKGDFASLPVALFVDGVNKIN